MSSYFAKLKRMLPPPNIHQSFSRRFLGTLVFWGLPMAIFYWLWDGAFSSPVRWRLVFIIALLATAEAFCYAALEHIFYEVVGKKKLLKQESDAYTNRQPDE
jgi:hypothetical protein